MIFISVTRLRVRSLRYLLQFIWYVLLTTRQAQNSTGFLSGKLLREARNTFWTVTAWEDEAAMRAYRGAGTHHRIMPKLLDWCDEASVAHWNQDSPELPEWQEAYGQMVKHGRVSKVNHPSSAQATGEIAEPQPSRIERRLKPSERSG
jgi:Antibiotic biosynthesis monooxygenase